MENIKVIKNQICHSGKSKFLLTVKKGLEKGEKSMKAWKETWHTDVKKYLRGQTIPIYK